MNSTGLIIEQKQKEANKKNIDMKIGFQNSVVRFSFLCRITDIKIPRINPYSTWNKRNKMSRVLFSYISNVREDFYGLKIFGKKEIIEKKYCQKKDSAKC